ncbi:alpha/beta hydrolase [Gordonia sp. HY285]|uniref:alpha/beta hydrolase n=1 Tax=Gordonia liuliyuniae TaxID=2911517 RepID=UPI001EED4EF8|nr:alpha/beta hydrolase-fold protein [Gordonia liuliyuniae]MCF8609575.1 alpha/beta hydrolase [Gordonia liuliyuniae]
MPDDRSTPVETTPHLGDLSSSLTSGGARPRAISRRGLLAGGAGLAVLGLGACASNDPLTPHGAAHVGADDELAIETTPASIPNDPPVVTGEFVSAKMAGRPTRWAVARPRGVTGELPVVVVAHALNTNEKTIFSHGLNIQGFVQQHVDAGNPPFAVACADVGDNYFHLRTDGADGAAMIIDEFVPMLEQSPELDLRTDKIGLFGWSMGGYGALRIGAILGPQRVAAIAVSSPAMWADPAQFPPRAFDSYGDYRANSMFGQQHVFANIPLMISVGTSDQFYMYARQWAADLHPPAAFSTSPGGHTNRYWRSALPDQIAFLGRSLAA